ncbi:hypothetical protein, partial [uncultured Vibrio sp.]|uniref:hypothetical protein n=1 Tax=uncultured Vibrio sp. TaxID=114054 RepID=UPI00262DFA0D
MSRMMKNAFFLMVVLLVGCASPQEDAFGNYSDVTLTPSEQVAVSQDIAQFLQRIDGSNRIFNLDHDKSTFAKTLVTELRAKGVGVSQGHERNYLTLS